MLCVVVFIVPTFKAPLIFNPPVDTKLPPVIAFDAVIVFDDAIVEAVMLLHVNAPALSILPFWFNVILSETP